MPGHRALVAIAGASGFIGTALRGALVDTYQIVALTRAHAQVPAQDRHPALRWQPCDLFSLAALRDCLTGVDYAIYLVHSLAPTSRLTQAKPSDMDLVLADNFAQAAADNGIKQIIVVGGLIPDGFRIAPLLWSRREVEMVLAARGTPVTALRVGLVVGPGGSATGLLVDLLRRLPILPLPPAALSVTRPIALTDLVRAVRCCLGRPEQYDGHFDIGGPDCLSYKAMLEETARALGLRRRIFTVPFMPLGLAAFAARLVSGAAPSRVGPIIESLPQNTVMRDNALQREIDVGAVPFRTALAGALDPTRRPLPSPRRRIEQDHRALIQRDSLVRSIQRLILPPGQDAAWMAGNYLRWLAHTSWPLLLGEPDGAGAWSICLRFPRWQLLRLEHAPDLSTAQRQVYRISGGRLARSDGAGCPRLEFQTLLRDRYTMFAIHDYAPALPWPLYRATQAVIHVRVMRRYQRHLARLAR